MKIKLRKFSLYPRLYSARIRENTDQNNSECKHFTCQQHFHELVHDQPLWFCIYKRCQWDAKIFWLQNLWIKYSPPGNLLPEDCNISTSNSEEKMDWLVDWYISVLHLLLWFKSKSLDFDNERETFHHGGGERVDFILSLVVCNSAKPKLDQKFYFTICEGVTFHSLLFNCWKFTRSSLKILPKNSEYGHTSCSEKSETLLTKWTSPLEYFKNSLLIIRKPIFQRTST